MKAVFISFNQAYYEHILALLDRFSIRGFTFWEEVQGRGSRGGEPHYGSHTWPTLNSSILAIMDPDQAALLLSALQEMDQRTPSQGLRAFEWDVTRSI